jgi:glycosyltransferase 2 family protein
MSQAGPKLNWRRLLLLLLLVLFTVWIFSRFANLRDLGATLLRANLLWIIVATLLHAGYFGMYAQLYNLNFALTGVKAEFKRILPILFAMLFANAVAPSGGTAGVALFVDNAVRWGESGARTVAGMVLTLVIDLATLIPFVAYALIFLALQGKLFFYDTLSSLFFVAYVILLTGALFLAGWKPGVMRRFLGWAQGLVNRIGARFHRPELLAPDWAEENARDLTHAGRAITSHPRRLAISLAWAFALHLVNLAGLYLLFVAFDQPVRLGTLVAGFSLGIIFWVVSLLPAGLAAVEGIMTLVFTDMGISADKAAAIVLTFRAMNFWLPVIVGFFALRQTSTFREMGRQPEEETEAGGREHHDGQSPQEEGEAP